MPGAGGTKVPFEAQALKGVIVRIIKIYTHNTKYFLQKNNLSGENNLAQVGELVARKVLFFEDMGQYDLMKKNVFGINVADFIEVDKGAIYNVRLSYNYDLSAYPVNERSQLSKEEMIAQAELEEIEEKAMSPIFCCNNLLSKLYTRYWNVVMEILNSLSRKSKY